MPAASPSGLWFLQWRIWQDARQRLTEALVPLGLSSREFWLLTLIREAPRPQRELAAVCGLDPSSMVALLDGLERRGLAARRRHAHDRRVHLIALTPAGEALYRRARPRAQRAERAQLSRLAPRQRGELLALLRQLVDATLPESPRT